MRIDTRIENTKREAMYNLGIFVSFEFDKDGDLKNNFYKQAESQTSHRILNCSLNEAYPDQQWENRALEAIRECDVLVVLIGEDTHNAPGVKVETDMARSLRKPIVQVRPQGRPYQGLTGLDEPIVWRWKRINAKLDSILP